MAFSVRLDHQTEQIVDRIARRTGRTKSDVVRSAIRRLADDEEPPPANSVYDLIADIVGIADGGDRHYAARSEEVLREMLKPRREKA